MGDESVDGMGDAAVADSTSTVDFFEHEPSKPEKIEMRKANKTPSEWLRMLCREWVMENEPVVDAIDSRFLDYKPYLKGLLSAQLLCRLSMPNPKDPSVDGSGVSNNVDFWGIMGVDDDFDKAYIIAQIERFCSIYNIRGLPDNDVEGMFGESLASQVDSATAAAAAAAGISVSPSGGVLLSPYMAGLDPTAAAAAAAAVAAAADTTGGKLTKKHAVEVTKAHKLAKDAERALEAERKQTIKREQRRLSQERKEQKAREREAIAMRKATERAAREQSREERRRKKLEIRMQREKFAQEQKEAALKRAAELVASNRVPIEITRGAAAAKAVANAALGTGQLMVLPEPEEPRKKPRSSIVVSTASDLHQIVTHSKNLWTKYNAIAKEHNQKVNWITVARELGIHVKVREKYARMHARAEQRGFDWSKNGHWKIKDHAQIFLEPTQAEQKAKMPPPPPDPSTTVLIEGSKEVAQVKEEAVAAAAAVLAKADDVVQAIVPPTEEQTAAAAAVAATMVADPTAGIVDGQLEAASVKADDVVMVPPTEEQAAAAAAVAATLVADPTAGIVHGQLDDEQKVVAQI